MKLTKGLLVLLVAAVLVLTIGVLRQPVQAASVDNSPISQKFAPGTTDAYCPVCKETVTWKPMTATKTYPKAGEHYYLEEDIRWVDTVSMFHFPQSVDGAVCVHLNGKTITSVEARVFDGGKGTLNIMGNGTVSSGKSGVGAILSTWGGETANFYGGTFRTTGSGSAIYVVGTVNIYDGVTIDASSARGGTLASCIYMEREEGVINLSGGRLIGTQITGNGGTVTASKGKFNMSGGTIEGGDATTTGGNVYVGAGTFTMSGGTIQGGKAGSNGGNLYVTGGTFKFTGGTIEGGTAVANGGNCAFHKADKLTMTGGTVKNGTATGSGGNLYFGMECVMKMSGGTIQDGTAQSGGNITTGAATFTMTNGQIKGGSATHGGSIYASSDSKLTLSGGTIDGGVAESIGGNIFLTAGNLTISGATLKNGKVNGGNTGGGNLYLTTDASAKMTSGTISGGTAKHGGNVYIYRGSLAMSGGKISGGTATGENGGCIYLYGWEEYKCKLTLSGGTIEGGTVYLAGPDATAKVTGGKMESKVEGKTENVTITGGSFSEYMEGNLGQNMDMYQTEDGNYIPYETSSVAVVGGKMYKSFAEAFKAATLENPVILLADVTEEVRVSGKKAINLGAHTMTSVVVENSGKLKLVNTQSGKVEKITAPMAQVELEGSQYDLTFGQITNTGTWVVDSNIYGNITNAGGAKLTISGGEFIGKLEGEGIVINGGIFAFDVKQMLGEGVSLLPIDGGRYIACDPKAVAVVEGKAYDTLQAALDTNPWGKTIYLLRDCDEAVKYEVKGKNGITLMTNGFTLKELTVGPSVNFTIDASRGGKVTTLHQHVRVRVPDNNYAAAIGTLYTYIDTEVSAGIYGDLYCQGNLTISGGEFTGIVSAKELKIADGTFAGAIQGEKTVITGGTFQEDVSQWVAEGYVCKKSGSGYVVGVPAPFNPIPVILAGGGGLLVIIVIVAILLTRPSKKAQPAEEEKEEA